MILCSLLLRSHYNTGLSHADQLVGFQSNLSIIWQVASFCLKAGWASPPARDPGRRGPWVRPVLGNTASMINLSGTSIEPHRGCSIKEARGDKRQDVATQMEHFEPTFCWTLKKYIKKKRARDTRVIWCAVGFIRHDEWLDCWAACSGACEAYGIIIYGFWVVIYTACLLAGKKKNTAAQSKRQAVPNSSSDKSKFCLLCWDAW